MEETEQLSNLIGDIYDAVLEPALWTGVVEKAGGFVGGSAASIFSQDTIRKVGNSYYSFGVDADYEQLYFNTYVRCDPLSAAYLTLGVGEVTSSSLIVPRPNSSKPVSTGNGRGLRAGSTTLSPYSRDRPTASAHSSFFAMNAKALLTITRAGSCA
jgi:hypothetical protein